jgi:hypothetical protein
VTERLFVTIKEVGPRTRFDARDGRVTVVAHLHQGGVQWCCGKGPYSGWMDVPRKAIHSVGVPLCDRCYRWIAQSEPHPSKRLSLLVDEGLMRALSSRARSQRIPRSRLVRDILREHVERTDSPPAPDPFPGAAVSMAWEGGEPSE